MAKRRDNWLSGGTRCPECNQGFVNRRKRQCPNPTCNTVLLLPGELIPSTAKIYYVYHSKLDSWIKGTTVLPSSI